jgi:hypothetical protein
MLSSFLLPVKKVNDRVAAEEARQSCPQPHQAYQRLQAAVVLVHRLGEPESLSYLAVWPYAFINSFRFVDQCFSKIKEYPLNSVQPGL